MINWHPIVSSPSNQKTFRFNEPIIFFDLFLLRFSLQEEANIYEMTLRRLRFIEEDNPSEKVVIVEEELVLWCYIW